MRLTVYIPQPDSFLSKTVLDGSAIVGSPAAGGRVRIDYEGGKFGQFGSWREMLEHAAGRHVTHYPTIARMWVDPADVLEVGTFDYDTRVLDVTDAEALEKWSPIHA
jgi:hypothetical protein